MPVWRGLAETIVCAISGGLAFCRFGTGVAGMAGCAWDGSEWALLFSSFVALFSDQVSCLAVHVAPFVRIKSSLDFFVFGGLNLMGVGFMSYVSRVSGDWCVPVGWIPA